MSQEIIIKNESIDIEDNSSTYYRSRIFTAHSGVNGLVTAGQALITLISSCKLDSVPEGFQENLAHELKTFSSRAQQFNVDPESIQIAKFILQTCIEARAKQEPIDQVFPVVDRLLTDPKKYIALIELSYICLSLSTQQEQRLEKLFQTIRHIRGDQPQKFYQESPRPEIPRSRFPLRNIIFSCLLTFILVYTGFAYIIHINHSFLPKSLRQPLSQTNYEDI